MKVVGMLSWYEERPSWLAATVASLRGLCDHLVAVDGAYQLFPDARPRSGAEQAEAIVETAHAAGIGLTLHRPKTVWRGNEVAKRNHLVQLAKLETDVADWLFRIDGDEVVTNIPDGFHARLADTLEDSAEVTLWWRSDFENTGCPPHIQQEYDCEGSTRGRFLFRAVPGIRVTGTHFGYESQWAGSLNDGDPADFSDLRVEHRHTYRRLDRKRRSEAYYRVRDELGIEGDRVPA